MRMPKLMLVIRRGWNSPAQRGCSLGNGRGFHDWVPKRAHVKYKQVNQIPPHRAPNRKEYACKLPHWKKRSTNPAPQAEPLSPTDDNSIEYPLIEPTCTALAMNASKSWVPAMICGVEFVEVELALEGRKAKNRILRRARCNRSASRPPVPARNAADRQNRHGIHLAGLCIDLRDARCEKCSPRAGSRR